LEQIRATTNLKLECFPSSTCHHFKQPDSHEVSIDAYGQSGRRGDRRISHGSGSDIESNQKAIAVSNRTPFRPPDHFFATHSTSHHNSNSCTDSAVAEA
jgi:hypothetical protein